MKSKMLIYCLFVPIIVFCQNSHVDWELKSRKKSDTVYRFILKATIENGWHIYAKDTILKADDNSPIEVTKPALSWHNRGIHLHGDWVSKTKTSEINDHLLFNRRLRVYTRYLEFEQEVGFSTTIPDKFKIIINAIISNGEEFLPITEDKIIDIEGGINISSLNRIKLSTIDLQNPAEKCGSSNKSSEAGLMAIFLLGFAGGFIALLTPCVFPMIPTTISVFTNKVSGRRQGIINGLLYGGFIVLIYVIVSVPFHLIGNFNPELFNVISTSPTVNIVFFMIFILFALSFFGLFEIDISRIANGVSSKTGLSFIGIFFMALTLAITSFSCTGPILGSLLVGSLSSDGGAWQLTAGLSGFGLALALPFAFLAMIPNWRKLIPTDKSWLGTTKKLLAFVELALALKFLSNADLVGHWGLLKREVFIGVWIIISLCLSFYLFGWLRFSNDYTQGISKSRKAFACLTFLFSLYLVQGLTNTEYANLTFLSGFPPPLEYSIYKKNKAERLINDYEKAIQLAMQQHKPLLIDFTGWACVNCRKMEEQVWSKKEIAQLIRDKFVLVSLYVDDRAKLPAKFIYVNAKGNKKEIGTHGDKWATFQAENFNQVSQPLYAILSPDEQLMNFPVAYTPDEKRYKDWLECGLNAFIKNKLNQKR